MNMFNADVEQLYEYLKMKCKWRFFSTFWVVWVGDTISCLNSPLPVKCMRYSQICPIQPVFPWSATHHWIVLCSILQATPAHTHNTFPSRIFGNNKNQITFCKNLNLCPISWWHRVNSSPLDKVISASQTIFSHAFLQQKHLYFD